MLWLVQALFKMHPSLVLSQLILIQLLFAAFVDVSPDETVLNSTYKSVEDSAVTGSSKDTQSAEEVSIFIFGL